MSEAKLPFGTCLTLLYLRLGKGGKVQYLMCLHCCANDFAPHELDRGQLAAGTPWSVRDPGLAWWPHRANPPRRNDAAPNHTLLQPHSLPCQVVGCETSCKQHGLRITRLINIKPCLPGRIDHVSAFVELQYFLLKIDMVHTYTAANSQAATLPRPLPRTWTPCAVTVSWV